MDTTIDKSKDAHKSAGTNARDFSSRIQGMDSVLDASPRSLGNQLGTLANNFTGSATAAVKSGRRYIEENPARSVAIAAACGVVAGSLLTIASRRRG